METYSLLVTTRYHLPPPYLRSGKKTEFISVQRRFEVLEYGLSRFSSVTSDKQIIQIRGSVAGTRRL